MFGRKKSASGPAGSSSSSETPFAREIRAILSNSADRHTLDVAAQIAALASTQDYNDDRVEYIRIQDIDHPCVCDLARMDGSPVGLSFSFYGTGGETGLIYLTTEFAQLAPQGANPGPRVPADMISHFVKDYDQAIRKLVFERSPRRAPEEIEQEQRLKSRLSEFLG